MQLYGSLLAASVDDRTLEYLILPFGEPGNTNVGTVTASAGSVTVPDPSAITFNIEHDSKRPVGRGVSVVQTVKGLVAKFRVASTRAGDDLLIEASEGLRTGASVEIDDPVIRQGRLISGLLTAVAAVVKPAFPSAQLQAADCGDIPTPGGTMPPTQPAAGSLQAGAADDLAAAVVAVVDESAAPAEEEVAASEPIAASRVPGPNSAMLAATVPGGIITPGSPQAQRRGVGRREAMRLIANAFSSPHSASRMLAAFTDIEQADVYDEATEPQWIGEVYARRQFTRKFAPLIGHDSLTGMTIKGYRFADEPDVDDWAGLGDPVPSGPVTAEEVIETAARIAGGWSVDRMYRDFPNPEFWDAFFRKAFKNYDKKVDAKVPAALKAAAGTVPGTADVIGAAPTGVSKLAHLLVELGVGMVEEVIPTFAISGLGIYKEFAKTTQNNDLAYIKSSFGLEQSDSLGIKVVPWAGLADDELLVGSVDSATLYELPGTPVRVDAEALSRGAVESAVFGYWAILTEDADVSLAYGSIA